MCRHFWRLHVFQAHQQGAPPYVPPKENADGTVDYTLIFRPLPKFEGNYWVLRFPKDWDVTPSETEDAGEVRLPNGRVWDFNAVPNDWVRIRLNLETLTPLKKGTPPGSGELWIEPTADPYLTKSKADYDRFMKETAEHCDKIGEIIPGVVAYKMRQPENVHRLKCFALTPDQTGYVVYDDRGKYIADINCADWNKTKARATCRGKIELMNGHAASVSLNTPLRSALPDEIKSIVTFTQRFLLDATVKRGAIEPFEQYSNQN
jgi:hypothetical protein